MATIQYTSVPLPQVFQHDSSVRLAIRSQDRILCHLDTALASYHMPWTTNSQRNVILCDLFVTANYWLKSLRDRDPAMKAGRYQAVLALFEVVAYDLQQQFGCKLTEVPHRITEMLGRDLTGDGLKTDEAMNAKFYDKLALRKCRLRFRAGRVFCYEDKDNRLVRLVPLNSDRFAEAEQIVVGGVKRLDGWGPFVMTVERDFYMSMHHVPNRAELKKGVQGTFHSAYKAAGTIAAAGTMLVKNGQILGIRGDSGHYWPLLHNMAMVVTALSMHSVPLMPITVLSFDKSVTVLGNADDFVRSRLTWEEFEKAAKDFRDKRLDRVRAGGTYGTQISAQTGQNDSGAYSRTPQNVRDQGGLPLDDYSRSP